MKNFKENANYLIQIYNERIENYINMFMKYMDMYIVASKIDLENYIKEGKTHLTIGIGCTGGQHRSIAIGIKIGQILQEEGYPVNLRHRDN